MLKENRKKYMLGILSTVAILFVTGVSYAIWSMTLTQESTNVINTACFKINFIEENEITLQNTYPITDEESKKLTPYTFRVENICNTNATYQINLEELESDLKKLSKEYIKVSLNDSKGKILNTYETVEKTLNEAETSKKLTTGVLKKGESKTFELRLWMDEDTPAIEDAMNANFESKITIIAVQKEGIPEVNIVAQEKEDGIKVDISTVENPKNETLTYFYQLNEEEEIESLENTYTFQGLSDGKYKVSVRAETQDEIILEEKELEVTIAYENVYVSSSGSDDTGNGSLENPFATLQPAYNKVKSGGSILLLSDIIATSTTNMNIENKSVTLRSNGTNNYSIIKSSTLTQPLADIWNSNTVTTSNITWDGNNVQNTLPLLRVVNSVLNLSSNSIIQNSTVINNNNGGGLLISSSTLNIDGGIIRNNRIESSSWANGGGIVARYQSTINMYSGSITNNTAYSSVSYQGEGGAIYLIESTFNFYDGDISENHAQVGGGVILVAGNTHKALMNMYGGQITNNTASSSGGGVVVTKVSASASQSLLTIKGGLISNNTAPTGPNTHTVNGGQIINEG